MSVFIGIVNLWILFLVIVKNIFNKEIVNVIKLVCKGSFCLNSNVFSIINKGFKYCKIVVVVVVLCLILM